MITTINEFRSIYESNANISMFNTEDNNLLLNVNVPPFMFIYDINKLYNNKLYGTLKYDNKSYTGYIKYYTGGGTGWNLKTDKNKMFDMDVLDLNSNSDTLRDKWGDFINEIIDVIYNEKRPIK